MLVVFFAFHILVLTISFCKVTSAPQRANTPVITSFSKGNVQIPSFRDDLSQNVSVFRTQKPMFQILRNLTKPRINNLKSNIFDKMLSEEMLSIKQRFFEKDLVQSTTVKVKPNSAPTPTVEVQQKWSVVNLFTNSLVDEPSESDEVATPPENKNDIIIDSENSLETDLISDDLESNNKSENKILELRSLPSERHAENQNHAQISPCASNHNMHATPKCSCSRPDHHRCTRCTHTVTDTSVSYSVYPLYLQPYQTFLFSDNLENPYENLYYHPKVVDDLKIPKKTKRRKTKPPPPDLYYDDNGSKEIDDDDEYSLKPRTKRPNIVMNIDYDLVDDKPKQSNCKKDDGNHFNLINDLSEVFNDGVNKKCYCSQSSLILPNQKNTLLFFVIVHVSIFS